jgi:hypothetical protein
MINNQQYLIPQQMMQQHNGQVAVAYTNANGQQMNPNNLAYVQTLNNNPQTVAQYTAAAQNNYTHQNNMLMNTNNLNSNVMMNKVDYIYIQILQIRFKNKKIKIQSGYIALLFQKHILS